MRNRGFILVSVIGLFLIFTACKKNKQQEEEDKKDDFNKTELLANVADNIIVPSFVAYNSSIDSLQTAATAFVSSKTTANLLALRTKFLNAYLAFETVSTFEFGPAENEVFRSGANTFPCDTLQMKSNVSSGTYDLNMASNFDAKGFPALDFLLYGRNNTDQQIIDAFSIDADAVKRCDYLAAIVTEIKTKATTILNQWNASYRNSFVGSTGSDIGSSVGLLVNQINQDFEITKNYRVGIPLGKKTMGVILPEKCEAYYSKSSLQLLKKHVESVEKIYLGGSGKGLDDYLDHLNSQYNGSSLNAAITNQFAVVKAKINLIPETLDNSIINNSAPVDVAYTEMQRLVVLLKTDMPSALGIVITYQDTDGD